MRLEVQRGGDLHARIFRSGLFAPFDAVQIASIEARFLGEVGQRVAADLTRFFDGDEWHAQEFRTFILESPQQNARGRTFRASL